MNDVKRICGRCGSDRTKHNEGISVVCDWRGHGIGLIGSCCAVEVHGMLNKLAVKYGGVIDENGGVVASPRGTPTIRSFEHLREEIGEAQASA